MTGVFGRQLFAIRSYTAHVPHAVKIFVAFIRQKLSSGFPSEAKIKSSR